MSLIRQENKSFSKLCKQKSAECQTLNFVCLVSCQVTVDIMGYIEYYCWGCFQVCLPDKQTRTHTQAHNYAGETNIRELSEEAYPSQDIVVHEHEHVPLGLMQESQDTNNFEKTRGPTGGQCALHISVLLGRRCQWHENHRLPPCPLGKRNFLLATLQYAISRTFPQPSQHWFLRFSLGDFWVQQSELWSR